MLEQFDGCAWSCGIVDEHHVGGLRDCGKTIAHRLAASGPAGNRDCRVGFERLSRLWTYYEHDPRTHKPSGSDRPIHNAAPGNNFKLLRTAESLAGAGGHDNRPHQRNRTGRVGSGQSGRHAYNGRAWSSTGPRRLATMPGMMLRELLTGVELFSKLSETQVEQIIAMTDTRDLQRGDVLFRENDEANEMFVVIRGRIAVGNRSFDGRESLVALMERGDPFGEMSFFDGGGRSAEARALEPSSVLSIPFGPLRAVYTQEPALLWQATELLALRLRNMDEVLSDAVFLDVIGRTAKRLLELSNDSDEFHIPVTQEELAGMVGASRERVNKAIAAFIRLGWIEQNGRDYRITKRRELEIRSR